MARKKREQNIGYYYLTNRSVGLRTLFVVGDDYRKFIDLLVELSVIHNFTLHSYSLLPYGYHLLIETKEYNLSKIMQLLSARYSHYFNRKYGRNGTLWEGRFQSSFMQESAYAFYFMRYIERLALMSGIVLNIQDYNYASYRQFIGVERRSSALENSLIFQRFNTIDAIKKFFDVSISKEYIDNIRRVLSQKDCALKVETKVELEAFFLLVSNKKQRTEAIYNAYCYGFSQVRIANFLELSQQFISKLIREEKLKNKGKK